ncbi:MAG: 16S rRNA (guanine(966)-N(2))-methyltransferase RsmD [Dehalococcoidia bacterium]
MRVIAGRAKGYSLKYPKEPRIRPTADIIRGAIFSALESADTDWTVTLDLYAGTGSLGIEALSRGASEADFVEKNPKCCSIIEDNLRHTGFTEQAGIYRMDAGKALRNLRKSYNTVFMDPPYSDQDCLAVLDALASSHLVMKDSTIVIEHSRRSSPEQRYGEFHITNSLKHGDTCVSIYQRDGGKN